MVTAQPQKKVKPVIVFNSDAHLVSMIEGFVGHSMASVDMTTIPKCTVKSRSNKELKYGEVYEGDLMCTSHRFIGIGYDYKVSTQNKIKKMIENGETVEPEVLEKFFPNTPISEIHETEIEVEGLPWGNWKEGSKVIIEHTPKNTDIFGYYLRISYVNVNGKYNEKTYHYENGDLIGERETAELDNFLPVKRESSPVVVNTVKVAGIMRLNFNGKIYVRKGYLTSEDKTKLNTWLDTVAEGDNEAIENLVA